MKRLSTKVAARCSKFLEVLNAAPLDVPIQFEHFEDIVREEGETKDVERKARYALDAAETILGPSKVVTRKEGLVTVTALSATIFDRRGHRAKQEKQVLSAAFCGWFFGWDAFPLQGKTKIEVSTFFHDPGSKGLGSPSDSLVARNGVMQEDFWQRSLQKTNRSNLENVLYRKLENIRKTAALVCTFDAGSTTMNLLEKFVGAKTVPIKVPIFFEDSPNYPGGDFRASAKINHGNIEMAHRLIFPTIITNSIPAADAVARSANRRAITLKLIGGTERVERRSICGEASLLWLKACRASGVLASTDIAVIGTTGYVRNHLAGLSGLGCDDPGEANLKSELLRMASNGLRVCVLDAKKLTTGEFNCCFASLSNASIDLAVIGMADETDANEVRKFCIDANQNNVGVIVGRTSET